MSSLNNKLKQINKDNNSNSISNFEKFHLLKNGVRTEIKSGNPSSNISFTLPDNDGDADNVLRTDGNGILSWVEQSGGSGNIDSITAGNGLTSSGTTNITLNVVGGDGITTNADEIEVNVDDSTIELSATDGSGSIRIKR